MKTVLITGGTKGIGREIAENYLKKGYLVIVNYANSDKDAEDFKNEMIDYIGKLFIVKADLSKIEGMELLVEEFSRLNVNLDILILNAGFTKRESFEDISYESWNRVIDGNFNIPFFLVQKLSNNINENGRIIFISSVLGIKADASSIQYGVSKGALIILSKYLAKYFASKKITVNCIAPGFVDTSWQKNKPVEQRERIKNKTLIKRFAYASEIASMCVNLEENEYITGQTIVIDGGYSLN